MYIHRKRKRHALLSQEIEDLENTYNDLQNAREKHILQLCETLRASSNISRDLNWKDFNKMCLFVNEHFYFLASKLQQTNTLNETEIRLCVLVLIGLSRTQIAEVLPYASNSVGKLKDHTAKLLGTTGKNLHDFLVKKAIEG
jgi:DNA-binding CsgD family transcriptional regulator